MFWGQDATGAPELRAVGGVLLPVLTPGTSSERRGLVGLVPLAPEMAAERVQLALPVRVLEVLQEPHPAGRASAQWPVPI